jgi:hypothetical protein
MLKILHCLDNRLTDGGKVVSHTCRTPLPPGRFPVLISVNGNIITLTGIEEGDLLSFTTLPELTALPRVTQARI